MQDKLNIIKGGVAKKDLTPILKHLKVQNGWITSTNGRLTISTPIPELSDLDIIVPADKFITAMKACKEPKFKITPTNKLSISDKGFKALLPLMEQTVFPTPEMSGDAVHSEDLISVLKMLQPFIGDDASRAWSCGILLYENMAYATNNTILVRHPVQWHGPPINLPDFLVEELIRIKKEIILIKANEKSITFQLEDDVWINSSLLSTQWPNAKEIFNKMDYNNLTEIPNGLDKEVRKVIPFCSNPKFPKIIFTETGICTEEGDTEAAIEVQGLSPSSWRAEPLIIVLESGLFWDFSKYPSPCPWKGNNGLEGVIVGLKN